MGPVEVRRYRPIACFQSIIFCYDFSHKIDCRNFRPLTFIHKMQNNSLHMFHIPVMGLAYTIDTPVKVAHFGIDSVISIIEDKLVELMRMHYYRKLDKPYRAISVKEDDYRAKRITDYLNLVNEIVKTNLEKVRNSVFDKGSEIARYFEMLPPGNALRRSFEKMRTLTSPQEQLAMSDFLRSQVRPGSIDVNIMTKVDKNNYDKEGNPLVDGSDAVAALRGYVNSNLTNSSVVFSAGLNPRLFNFLERTSAFDANTNGDFKKKITIKVSDYRSALIQGKYLAKKGLWVSEFRVESGLNCGGHAFATDGSLLGPILEDFKRNRESLVNELFQLYTQAAIARGKAVFDSPHPVRITVQGGIGTYEEAEFLHRHYQVDSTGWGTPFLLCPEATTVDEPTLKLLSKAGQDDVILSHNSPLGVRFNYLKGTSSDKEKHDRIAKGKPGSPCTEKHLVSNTEFTKEPICTASHNYQKMKIEQLQSMNLPAPEYQKQYESVVSKECLCVGLINPAIVSYNLPPIKKLTAVTICPGPNIAYFSRIVSLQEMADHIYGRGNVLDTNERPHMFLKELQLNIDYLNEQLAAITEPADKAMKDLAGFARQLISGVAYYRDIVSEMGIGQEAFLDQLDSCEGEISSIMARLSSWPEQQETRKVTSLSAVKT